MDTVDQATSSGTTQLRSGVLRGERFVSLEELRARALRAAAGLRSLGVDAGDGIALLLRNDHELFEALFAASYVGATSTPINWHGTAEEVEYVVEDSRAKVLVAHADLLAPIRHVVPADVTVIGVTTPASIAAAYDIAASTTELPSDVPEWSTWRDGFAPLETPRLDLPSSMIYTSGTTGHPKGVRRLAGAIDDAAVAAYYMDSFRVFGAWPQMRTVIPGPMYHSAPLAYASGAARTFDGFLVLQDRFEPEELLRLVEQYRIDSLYLVPTMFVRLLRLAPEVRDRYDVSSLRNVSHTAAPCPPEVKRAMIEWLGPIITEFYGSTEVGLVAGCDSEEWLAHPGTVGRPLATCTIRILDEAGTLAQGGIGEIFMRAGGFTDFTYEGRPQSRAEVEREGLITCGDVGYFDEDGYLYVCDRVRDMVISGGVNIYPIEIEACLLTLNGVADCAVFGIPDPEYGESIAAAVQLEPGAALSVEQVQAHVRAHLSAFKVPTVVEFHDSLPREDSGKMFKRKLRAPFWEQAGRNI
jgi:long-chain acyl-CoA synthetase